MKIHVGVACYTCNYFLGTLHFHTSIDNPLHMVSVSYHSHDFFYCCAFLFLFRVLRRATEEVNETNSEIEDVNEAVTDTETEDKVSLFQVFWISLYPFLYVVNVLFLNFNIIHNITILTGLWGSNSLFIEQWFSGNALSEIFFAL